MGGGLMGVGREGEGGPLHLPHQRHIPPPPRPSLHRRADRTVGGAVSITRPIVSFSGSDRNVQITSRTRKKSNHCQGYVAIIIRKLLSFL